METIEYKKMFKHEDKHWWFATKRKFTETVLSKLPKVKNRKILDIGCGTGVNLKFLSRWGKVAGIDYSATAVDFCRRRGFKNVTKASASRLPFADNSFDLVTFFDVLYHQGIKDDVKALKEANRVLKLGGKILITDCAHQWLHGPHDKAVHARQRYAKKELEAKVKKAGFKIQRSSFIFMTTFPLFLVNRLLAKITHRAGSDVALLPDTINLILTVQGRWEAQILRLINLPWGSSIIILALK